MRKLLSGLSASFLALSVAVTPVIPASAGVINMPRPETAQPTTDGLQQVQYRLRRGGAVRWHGPRGGGAVRWHGPRSSGVRWHGPRSSGVRWHGMRSSGVRWHGSRGTVVRWHGPRGGAVRWRGPRGTVTRWHGPRGGGWHAARWHGPRGGVWRGGNYYWRGYRGYRNYHPGYRYYSGWWFPSAAFVAGAIVGGALAAPNTYYMSDSAHVNWCYNRYRSYRASDNTFQPYNGPRRQCISPYGG